MEDKNLNRIIKGLHTDSSPQDQPKETYRFGLNVIMETDQGDNNFGSNEESNEACGFLTPGFIPIGKVYIGNDRTVIFSVSADDSISEIGIYYANNCEYVSIVNDSTSIPKDKLNFSVQYQIQATYRLRRGCEDTIYWVDANNRPRYFNFHKPDQFKNQNGTWADTKFNLQKTYERIPNFETAEVLDSGGNLEPGSYNFAIQYIDESLNPTEWISTSPVIRIYNDLSTKEYGEINGSINSDADYINFPKTGKSIKMKVSNLDPGFLYYRLAIIVSNNGSGLINDVFYTETIPISKNFFIYTGENHTQQGTEEEILQFTDIIEKAGSIEQIENRLILGRTEGSQVDFCKLQKYASRIKSDCITKSVILNDIKDTANTKNPTHEFNNGLGYMPGEIYSFGILYIFEDNTISPVYHIPGKALQDDGVVFSPVYNAGKLITYPMSVDNTSTNTIYTSNSTCGSSNYWGLDYNGTPLAGKPVRHHRFPLRGKINLPLVENTFGPQQVTNYYNINLRIQGTLKTPVPCPDNNPTCGTDKYYEFQIRVDYKVDGIDYSFSENIDPQMFANGFDDTYVIDVSEKSPYHGSNNITDIQLSVTDIYGNLHPVVGFDFSEYFVGNPTFTTTTELYSSTVQDKVVTGNILGIRFSNIEKPPLALTNGLEVIGYYIVRNERTEFEKTILDSAVLFPTVVNNEYISHGLLQPETNSKSSDVYALLHPEHKFNNREYVTYDRLIQEGNYEIVERKYGKTGYDDVYDGSAYDGKYHKDGNHDGQPADGDPNGRGFDGWSFTLISRDNIVNFKASNSFNFSKTDLKEIFYLDALGHKAINESKDYVYNIACDNKIGIIQLEVGKTISSNNNLPYVLMYKENADPYSNFRILPYYKETVNPIYFGGSTVQTNNIFNGDSYISPMRYTNTVYWDNRVADRQGKKSVLKIILGAVLVVAGAVLAFFTAGASTVLVGAGIALIGAGALFVSSGIKLENYNKAYAEEYDKGLRQTALDNWTDMFYNFRPGNPFGYTGNGIPGNNGPEDDTIEWINECVTDLWFESAINMNLRNGFVDDVSPTFLPSPWKVETGNQSPIHTWNFFDRNFTSSSPRYPISTLESHGARKLLAFDDTRDDNRYYLGLALGEYYNINPDYYRRNKQKIYYHLPLEYDCCSECNEDFPHRIHYSEQSFQEELSDNFRVFLPNNYRDIEGETGKITNLYRLGMDLYVHTEEALWQIPRNYQERITDQIVSFIGSGEYFSIPPRKIIDDDTGNSAGCQHKWGAIKTPAGLIFPSENQNKIYQFDGRNLKAISNRGISKELKNKVEVKTDRNYFNLKKEEYPFRDNPSNTFGTGYISTYDSRKERFILTKKDLVYKNLFGNSDFELCIRNGELIMFPNSSEIIDAEETQGWVYTGLENCRMKFEREVIKTRIEERIIETTIPDTTHIFAYFDTSGSFNNAQLDSIRDALDAWYSNFRPSDPGKTMLHKINNSNERWLEFALQAMNSSLHNGDVLVLTFVNEADPFYHNTNMEIGTNQPTPEFIQDYNAFRLKYPTMNFFLGINYPIATNYIAYDYARPFIQHALMSINGESFTTSEANTILGTLNSAIFNTSTKNVMRNNMTGPNPYQALGPYLKDMGWVYKVDRNDIDYITSGGSIPIITPQQFANDINAFLQDVTTIETIEVEVQYTETEYKYIDGEVIEPETVNNSWTLSYSLKEEYWISWHSYIPNFYLNIPEDFFAWIHGNNAIWKFNKLGEYQNFFGKRHPFIIEYVSLSNPLSTRVWEYIKLLTEAKKYNAEFNEFVDERFVTFNKGLFYNSRQSSGILNFLVKDINPDSDDYLLQQVQNLPGDTIIIDRNERDWTINQMRDIRVNYSEPIFNSNIESLQDDYFIDKIVNENAIDIDKDWTELESFRDKYLVIRLIFDNFDDVKLLLNYSVENEVQSFR